MAWPTVTVQGKVLLPGGSGPKSGSIVVELSQQGKIQDGSDWHTIGGRRIFDIADGGAVDFELEPNDQIYVAGQPSVTSWIADFTLLDEDGQVHFTREFWNLPSSPDPTTIGAIQVTNVPEMAGVQSRDRLVTVLPTPSEAFRGTRLTLVSGAGVHDKSYICVKDGTDTYVWQLVYVMPEFFTVSSLPTPDPDELGHVALLDTGSGETAAYMLHRTEDDTYEWVYSSGGPATERSFIALPDAGSYDLGTVIMLDPTPGAGETSAWMAHRLGDDTVDWVLVSNGGTK